MTSAIFFLPQAVLTSSIAEQFLSTHEQLHFFATCKAWQALLQEVRTFTFQDESQLRRFMQDIAYRQTICGLLGYKNNHNNNNEDEEAAKNKLTSTTSSFLPKKLKFNPYSSTYSDEDLLHAFLHKYAQLTSSLPSLEVQHTSKLLPSIALFPHLSNAVQQSKASITLHIHDLHKLHRLRINKYHHIENITDLNDPQYSSDDFRPLSELKGIRTIYIRNNQTCELQLAYQTTLQRVVLTQCDELVDIGCLQGVVQVEIEACHNLSNVVPLANANMVELNNCIGITDITPLTQVKAIVLRKLTQLTDIAAICHASYVEIAECDQIADVSMLRRVPRLQLLKCAGLLQHSHNNVEEGFLHPDEDPKLLYRQNWSFIHLNVTWKHLETFDKLNRLNLRNCVEVEDLGMLGGILCLEVSACPSIKTFPTPTGKGQQRWKFASVPISNLIGFHVLHSVELDSCDTITDVSMLSHVKDLTIRHCAQLTDISNLSHIQRLSIATKATLLNLSHLEHIQYLDVSAQNAVTLAHVNRIGTCKLSRMATNCHLFNLQQIQRMYIDSCKCNIDLNVIVAANVRYLQLRHCSEIRDVSMLPGIHELSLSQCNNVESITGLHNIYGTDVPEPLRTARSRWFYDCSSFAANK